MMLKLVDCMSMCNARRRPDVVHTCATARHDRSRNTTVHYVETPVDYKHTGEDFQGSGPHPPSQSHYIYRPPCR